MKPNKNIKKLSTAIERGYEITQEHGIKRITEQNFQFHTKTKGKVIGACAMGMAYLGILGTKAATMDYAQKTVIDQQLKLYDYKTAELKKALGPKSRIKLPLGYSLRESVHHFNDTSKMPIPRIIEILKKAGV